MKMLPLKRLILLCAVLFINLPAVRGALIFTPLSLQSGSIPFTDCISLLTLCFAPLIAHIFSGVPKSTVLHSCGPGWLDRLTVYNPMSIMWRYFAIADRRLRSRGGIWTPNQLAAANAVFWTEDGWNGSESMSLLTRRFIIDLPEKSHTRLLSASTIKTIIITLQGVQAACIFSSGVIEMTTGYVNSATWSIAVDSIFGPLTIIGLLRLCATFWLTNDFTYSYDISDHGGKQRLQNPFGISPLRGLRPTCDWRSWIFRLLYFSVIAFSWTVAILFFIFAARPSINEITANYILIFYYLLILTPIMVMFAYYFVRGHCTTTIIPCASSTWYKIYSIILGVATVFLIILAGVETRITPCGRSTMWPSSYIGVAQGLCPSLQLIDPKYSTGPFGLATWGQVEHNGSLKLVAGDFRVIEFTGYF